MSVTQKPALKLATKLLMTPALQQAIKLLQLTRLELEQLIRAELEVNPLLVTQEDLLEEEINGSAGEGSAAELGIFPGGNEPLPPEEREEFSSAASISEVDIASLFANDVHDVLPQGVAPWDEDELDSLANVPAATLSMTEELLQQLRLSQIPEQLLPIAEFILGNLDPDGYLRTPLAELARHLGVETCRVDEALSWVQKLDPPGIGARNIQECLLLQLDRLTLGDRELYLLTRRLVTEGFSELLGQQWKKLTERLGVSEDDLRRCLDLLRKLPLHPGALLGSSEPQPIAPDVIVRKVNGRWQVELVEDELPKVYLSPRYLRLLENRKQEPEVIEFVREKMRQAMWFLRAVEQRQSTVLKVAQMIVRRQENFFERGLAGLKPMVLRDVADEIGMHESTVSRVVQAKYMDTPRGLLPLKFFFHSALSHALSGEVSSVAVKAKIRELILAEEPEKPLADARIARLLNRQGIRIARRTVAKYREEMGIPSSEARKRGKRLK